MRAFFILDNYVVWARFRTEALPTRNAQLVGSSNRLRAVFVSSFVYLLAVRSWQLAGSIEFSTEDQRRD
jgi:hypothetical protein